jgi:hypothetical protein
MQRPARKLRISPVLRPLAVIVEAAHRHGARARIAVDDHLHDGGGLAEFAVGLVLGLREDSGRAHDLRVQVWIELRRRAEAVRQVGGLEIAAFHELLHFCSSWRQSRSREIGLRLPSASSIRAPRSRRPGS